MAAPAFYPERTRPAARFFGRKLQLPDLVRRDLPVRLFPLDMFRFTHGLFFQGAALSKPPSVSLSAIHFFLEQSPFLVNSNRGLFPNHDDRSAESCNQPCAATAERIRGRAPGPVDLLYVTQSSAPSLDERSVATRHTSLLHWSLLHASPLVHVLLKGVSLLRCVCCENSSSSSLPSPFSSS
jgi:hypothetical protein